MRRLSSSGGGQVSRNPHVYWFRRNVTYLNAPSKPLSGRRFGRQTGRGARAGTVQAALAESGPKAVISYDDLRELLGASFRSRHHKNTK